MPVWTHAVPRPALLVETPHASPPPQMAFMALAFGGPDSYRGRDMRTAHQGLPVRCWAAVSPQPAVHSGTAAGNSFGEPVTHPRIHAL